MSGTFPFGAPLRSCVPRIDEPRPVLVLGAYPSAVHVRWTPPPETRLKAIRALAIDNEPVAFWDGSDEEERVAAWAAAHFQDDWGSVAPVQRLNGSSGSWLRSQVLGPLGIDPQAVWATDCLDTYRVSRGGARRIEDTYDVARRSLVLPTVTLPPHPTENQIVREALSLQMDRLVAELEVASPSLLITLGNAAHRVIRELLGITGRFPARLSRDEYGSPRRVQADGVDLTWRAFVHPGAPAHWQDLHSRWIAQAARR